MEQDRFRERRRVRLWAEMADAGLRLRLDGPAGQALLAEVDYARFPPGHEGEFPTYGAVLLAGGGPAPEDFGATVHPVPPGAEKVMRLMADGRQGFLLRRRGRVALLALPTPHDREGELVRLRRQLGASRFTAVHRTPAGVVRVFGRSALAVWDGGHWWEKPYADAYARALLRAVPDATPAAAEAILEFCVHTMSPSSAGATLVWALDTRLATRGAGTGGRYVPRLSLEDRTNHGPLRQLLSQSDGAALLSPDAEVVQVGLYLQASPEAYAAAGVDPTQGTRHASASRWSFDHADAVVFVVSQDGPVTVYARGTVVASIRSRLQEDGSDALEAGGGDAPPPVPGPLRDRPSPAAADRYGEESRPLRRGPRGR